MLEIITNSYAAMPAGGYANALYICNQPRLPQKELQHSFFFRNNINCTIFVDGAIATMC
ncbi:hypothetical protein [Nostoc sp. UHCC 0251]|uniref:hypothetical protein n=1 Tax=Nostoc sp. UHCC 0251 TaxID=3110240 RepID=UPI002B1FF84E|nr:hypothetical protein [Nostoc sp. UHCC 0251]MEA5626059.1 hypothetical protein [Nostoc sp. UHCC 0251]